MDPHRTTGAASVSAHAAAVSVKTRHFAAACFLLFFTLSITWAQAVPYARTFPRSKAEVELALKDMQANAGQKLPIVDGFVGTLSQPLEQYERAFYQFSIEVLPGPSGGTSVVQVSAKITAWYKDKDPAKSGYQVLPSNGRLELDLLDRLDEKFGNKPAPGSARALATSAISAPAPKLNLGPEQNLLSGAGNPIPPPEGAEELNKLRMAREAEEKRMRSLNTELQSLEEIKKNQAHPLNLVTVRKNATPVLAHTGDDARILFRAAINDEFEFLDADGDWVHVQISGVSRGYIRRSFVELPEFIARRLQDSADADSHAKPEAYRVAREETSTFPGDWEPLKGKNVKIYTVQPASTDPKETGARAKLSFAASLMRKFAADPASGAANVSGVVVIFDSADGGIAAATVASIQQLSQNSLKEEIFWKQGYLDPPETFQLKVLSPKTPN
jgi:hypothetical protein